MLAWNEIVDKYLQLIDMKINSNVNIYDIINALPLQIILSSKAKLYFLYQSKLMTITKSPIVSASKDSINILL